MRALTSQRDRENAFAGASDGGRVNVLQYSLAEFRMTSESHPHRHRFGSGSGARHQPHHPAISGNPILGLRQHAEIIFASIGIGP